MEEFLATHHAWIVFFGAFFLGETLILTASALAAHGHFSVFAVVIWAYLGTVLSDGMWFLLARPAKLFFDRSGRGRVRYQRVLEWLDRRFGPHPERALLFIKFVYGARLATIVYLAIRRVRFRTFMGMNGAGAAPWLAAVVTVGWLAGKGLSYLGPQLSRLEYLLPLVLALALIIQGVVKWLSRRSIER